jgi:hypothetical protein
MPYGSCDGTPTHQKVYFRELWRPAPEAAPQRDPVVIVPPARPRTG